MYRKQVRRRRAVLALLVIGSFVLLTATYGSDSGGLQKGVSAVFGPLEEGADRALKPARDLINWFDETFDARGENDELQAEVEELRRQVIGSEVALQENGQLKGLLDLRRSEVIPSGYEEVAARVIGRSPTLWYASIQIDRGSSSGVAVKDPVVSGDALVGTVRSVTSGTAQVTLITDPESSVTAKVVRGGAQGVVSAEVGDPDDLVLDFIDTAKRIRRGQPVVTAGWRSPELEVDSKYPPNIPIGEITEAPVDLVEAAQQVHLRPYADMRKLDFVDVLTGGVPLIVTPKVLLRIAAIIIVGVLLQLSFFSKITFLHTTPDILPALVVVLGLLGGSMTGAVAGFSVGLLVDCLLVAPLGATSLVLLSTGYLAGLYRERFDVTSSLIPPLLCMGLTLFATTAFAALQLLLGVEAPVSILVARDIVIKSIFAFFLGVPIYFAVRRALRPALIEERQAKRRRIQPTMLGA